MRSFKRLAVSALVSAALCQSGASALPTAGRVVVGVGVPLAILGTFFCVGYYEDAQDDAQYEAEKKARLEKTMAKIDNCVGYHQREFFRLCFDEFFSNEDKRSVNSDELEKRVEGLVLSDKGSIQGNSLVELKSKEELCSFLKGNPKKKICNFCPEDVIDIANRCMRIFTRGVKESDLDKIVKIKSNDKEWSDGFAFNGFEVYHRKDGGRIKLVERFTVGDHNLSCEIILRS